MSLLSTLRAMVETMPPGAGVTLPADWLKDQLDTEGDPNAKEAEERGDLGVEEIAKLAGRTPSTVRGWFGQGLFGPTAYKCNGVDWRCPLDAWHAAQERMRAGTFYPTREKTQAGQARPVRLDSWRDDVPDATGTRRRRRSVRRKP